jgi:hypothetical protein
MLPFRTSTQRRKRAREHIRLAWDRLAFLLPVSVLANTDVC